MIEETELELNRFVEEWTGTNDGTRAIFQRLKEILSEKGFEHNCPLCQLMMQESYDIVYFCQILCCECAKADICENFDPHSP